MANPMKGEARLGEFTLAYNFGAFCELEAKTGMKMPQLLASISDGLGFGELRDFVYVGLQTHHKGVSEQTVLLLLDEQGYEKAAKAVGEAVTAFFGKPKEKNPPQRAAA